MPTGCFRSRGKRALLARRGRRVLPGRRATPARKGRLARPAASAGNVTGPASSVDNRIAVFNGLTGTVIKDGGKTIADLLAAVVMADVPPTSAASNSFWLETDTGILYIRWDDGTSAQWVAIGGGPVGATGPSGPSGAKGDTGAQGPPGANGTGIGDMLAANNLSELAATAATARHNIYAAPFDALAYNGMQINGAMEELARSWDLDQ